MSGHGKMGVIVAGSVLPVLSIAWEQPTVATDSGFSILLSDYEEFEGDYLCLHCVVDAGDEVLGRGLDLARRFGQVDRDDETGEWLVPPLERLSG